MTNIKDNSYLEKKVKEQESNISDLGTRTTSLENDVSIAQSDIELLQSDLTSGLNSKIDKSNIVHTINKTHTTDKVLDAQLVSIGFSNTEKFMLENKTQIAELRNYSEQETVIGLWIDRKKLYRKVIVDTTLNYIDITGLDVKYINISNSMMCIDGGWTPCFCNPNYYCYLTATSVDLNSDGVNEEIIMPVKKDGLNLSKIIYIIDYTKASESPITE